MKNTFLFSKDIGGNEKFQIYFFDLCSGKFQLLTDGKSRNGTVKWSNKGESFAYYSTQRNGKDFDIYVCSLSGNQPVKFESRLVFEASGTFYIQDWSPDDKFLILLNYIFVIESKLFILEIETKKSTEIGYLVSSNHEAIAYGEAHWDKKGHGIFFTANYKS